MGFATFFKEAVKGNFSDAANFLFVDEDNLRVTKEVASAQQKLAEAQFNEGTISKERYAELAGDIGYARNLTTFRDSFKTDQSPISGFKEGLKEGLENEKAFVTGAFEGGIGAVLRNVPIPVYLVIGAVVLLYLNPGFFARLFKR